MTAKMKGSYMAKGKAFLVVGHENWGKSRTLHSLLKGKKFGWLEWSNGQWIFVKTMSNDDDPTSLINFVKSLNVNSKPTIIIALCPNFDEKNRMTKEILDTLSDKYSIFFFVLKWNYYKTKSIDTAQIDQLRNYGQIQIVENDVEDYLRARQLTDFISNNL
jgi:hypothetical protein